MKKHSILIVDDEPHVLSSLKKILESQDRDILTAEDAEKAEKVLNESKEIEVIICDNRLPGTLGIDFLTKIKRLHPDTIRILITGYPDLTTAMDAINRAHIWRYILKPIEVEELKILINQAFDYYYILKENRMLLQIARKQAEWLKALKERHPDIAKEISDDSEAINRLIADKHISSMLAEFMRQYYSIG